MVELSINATGITTSPCREVPVAEVDVTPARGCSTSSKDRCDSSYTTESSVLVEWNLPLKILEVVVVCCRHKKNARRRNNDGMA